MKRSLLGVLLVGSPPAMANPEAKSSSMRSRQAISVRPSVDEVARTPRAIDPATVARVLEAKTGVEPQPSSVVERPSTWADPRRTTTDREPWRARWMLRPMRSATGGKGITLRVRW